MRRSASDSRGSAAPTVSAIVLAYRDEPWLERCVHALLAAESLKAKGLTCRVLSVHTIKPLDTAAILSAARQCRAIVTVEEHLTNGGLGEAAAAVLMQAGVRVPFKIVAIPDEYTVTGSQADIFRHYGVSMEGLAMVGQDFPR